jgi:uncharacterized protein (UPF0297 family)
MKVIEDDFNRLKHDEILEKFYESLNQKGFNIQK